MLVDFVSYHVVCTLYGVCGTSKLKVSGREDEMLLSGQEMLSRESFTSAQSWEMKQVCIVDSEMEAEEKSREVSSGTGENISAFLSHYTWLKRLLQTNPSMSHSRG